MTTDRPVHGPVPRPGGVALALDLADGALPSVVHRGAAGSDGGDVPGGAE
ncbi:hypothetical protein [Oerskovia enterophila]